MAFMTCEKIKNKSNQMQEELDRIRHMESKFPEGEILCTKNGKRYKWLLKDAEETIYLPKSRFLLAEQLALKKYYALKRKELEEELSACDTYLRKMSRVEGKAESLLVHPEYGRLLQKQFTPVQESLREWQNAAYEKCTIFEEKRIIKGTQGKMLRSKSEAIIDMMLYKNCIPFRYEAALTLGTVTIYPDFTIRHPATGEVLYWEHFGLMEDENYRNHACDKIRLYCQNGIFPSIQLIMTFETKEHPLSAENVEHIIKEYFYRSTPPIWLLRIDSQWIAKQRRLRRLNRP